jgi:hypothetical protein
MSTRIANGPDCLHRPDEGLTVQLEGGDQFPRLTAMGLDDTEVAIPDVFEGSWGIVLMYRGHW